MKYLFLLAILLSTLTSSYVQSQELSFTKKSEWGSGTYKSAAKLNDIYYVSSTGKFLDVIDSNKSGPESLIKQLYLDNTFISDIAVFKDYLVITFYNKLSIYSIKDNVELTLEYSINVDGVLQDGTLFVSDAIAVVDHNNNIYHIKELNGEFSNDFIIEGSTNFSQEVSSVQLRKVSVDDEFLYFFYGHDLADRTNRTLTIDKYRLDNQTLVQQSSLDTTQSFGLLLLENIGKGQFIFNATEGLYIIDLVNNPTFTLTDITSSVGRMSYYAGYVYIQFPGSLRAYSIDSNLNLTLESSVSNPIFDDEMTSMNWLDDLLFVTTGSDGLTEINITGPTWNSSLTHYNQTGGAGSGFFVENKYLMPRGKRIDVLTLDDSRNIINRKIVEKKINTLIPFEDKFLTLENYNLVLNKWSDDLGWENLKEWGSDNYYGILAVNKTFAFVQGHSSGSFGVFRIDLTSEAKSTNNGVFVSNPDGESYCYGDSIILENKLLIADTCSGLIHIYNSTVDTFNYGESIPHNFDNIEELPSFKEYFYFANKETLSIHSLSENNELIDVLSIEESFTSTHPNLKVVDNYLFVITPYEIKMYDLSTPDEPRLVSSKVIEGNLSTAPTISYSENILALNYESDGKVRFYEINKAPQLENSSLVITEDSTLDLSALFKDPEGDALTYVLISEPLHGEINLIDSPNTYIPTKDFNGDDAFTLKVEDVNGNFIEKVILVEVSPVDDIPQMNDVSVSVSHNESFSGELIKVDIDNEALIYTLTDNVSNGELTISDKGVYSYTPAEGYAGNDSFSVEVTDGKSNVIATVTLTIASATPVTIPSESEKGGGSTGLFMIFILVFFFLQRKNIPTL
jgi:hypothetical protein